MTKLLPIIELKTTASLMSNRASLNLWYSFQIFLFWSSNITVNVCFPSVVALWATDMFGLITVFVFLSISWAVPRGSWWSPHGASIRLRRASLSPSSLLASTKSGEYAINGARNQLGIGLLPARPATYAGRTNLGHHFDKRLESLAPCYSQSLLLLGFKESHTLLWFKNIYKKTHETRKLESAHEKHFIEGKNEGRKPDKRSSLIRFEFMPRNLD